MVSQSVSHFQVAVCIFMDLSLQNIRKMAANCKKPNINLAEMNMDRPTDNVTYEAYEKI